MIATDGGIRFSNAPDVTHLEMTRFTDQVDLTCKRHVRIEDETQVPSRCADWNCGIADRDRGDIGKLFPLCEVPIRSNSVSDGVSMSLLLCVQETMSLKAAMSQFHNHKYHTGHFWHHAPRQYIPAERLLPISRRLEVPTYLADYIHEHGVNVVYLLST